MELRKGKWTVEEENYANKIISLFNQGMLPVVVGTTLRTYLSDKLRCDPMRITKKYAGASCIGKQVFQLADNYYEVFQENERELQRLEALFLARINGKTGSGLAGKRSNSSDALSAHPSIYETANPGRSALELRMSPPQPRRTPQDKKRGGRTPTLKVEGSPGKYRRSSSEPYQSHGSAVDDSVDAGEEYGYSYDPDYEDEGIAMRGLHASFQQQGYVGGYHVEGSNRGLYSNPSMGRRVLSAPNLSELSLSSWKETDYRPLPADSLREMFSQPIAGIAAAGEAGRGAVRYAGGASREPSLLPPHVYSALGTESGRYGAAGGVAGRLPALSHAHSLHPRMPPQDPSRLHQQHNHQHHHHQDTEGPAGQDYSSMQARKRCFSAMALVDFEKLTPDDIAAGDLFLNFLDKVGGTGGSETGDSTSAEEGTVTAGMPAGDGTSAAVKVEDGPSVESPARDAQAPMSPPSAANSASAVTTEDRAADSPDHRAVADSAEARTDPDTAAEP